MWPTGRGLDTSGGALHTCEAFVTLSSGTMDVIESGHSGQCTLYVRLCMQYSEPEGIGVSALRTVFILYLYIYYGYFPVSYTHLTLPTN